eukprot:TRINITY_DN14113_c0_g1_i1.p1 TRINITY_DN14113_c0_g1~~TRINITY_DN14113_c0_g1_i1.p1  ORF type:complete len:800 (+),score=149.40 TRINITY_DN14113_c0_g1_i1:138-2402(+)
MRPSGCTAQADRLRGLVVEETQEVERLNAELRARDWERWQLLQLLREKDVQLASEASAASRHRSVLASARQVSRRWRLASSFRAWREDVRDACNTRRVERTVLQAKRRLAASRISHSCDALRLTLRGAEQRQLGFAFRQLRLQMVSSSSSSLAATPPSPPISVGVEMIEARARARDVPPLPGSCGSSCVLGCPSDGCIAEGAGCTTPRRQHVLCADVDSADSSIEALGCRVTAGDGTALTTSSAPSSLRKSWQPSPTPVAAGARSRLVACDSCRVCGSATGGPSPSEASTSAPSISSAVSQSMAPSSCLGDALLPTLTPSLGVTSTRPWGVARLGLALESWRLRRLRWAVRSWPREECGPLGESTASYSSSCTHGIVPCSNGMGSTEKIAQLEQQTAEFQERLRESESLVVESQRRLEEANVASRSLEAQRARDFAWRSDAEVRIHRMVACGEHLERERTRLRQQLSDARKQLRARTERLEALQGSLEQEEQHAESLRARASSLQQEKASAEHQAERERRRCSEENSRRSAEFAAVWSEHRELHAELRSALHEKWQLDTEVRRATEAAALAESRCTAAEEEAVARGFAEGQRREHAAALDAAVRRARAEFSGEQAACGEMAAELRGRLAEVQAEQDAGRQAAAAASAPPASALPSGAATPRLRELDAYAELVERLRAELIREREEREAAVRSLASLRGSYRLLLERAGGSGSSGAGAGNRAGGGGGANSNPLFAALGSMRSAGAGSTAGVAAVH